MSGIFQIFSRKPRSVPEEDQQVLAEQEEMKEGIENLADTTVKEVMVPRTDTVFIPFDAPRQEILDTLISSGHSRIPVYRETMDQVVGIIYAKDVLASLIRNGKIEAAALMRKPFFVPETKKIDSLLKEFKRKHVHIAVVVDEYGGTSGIVCLEDIIEEIVGEIQDEFDNEKEPIIQTAPNTFICDARARLDDISKELSINLPAEEFESLAGYVFDLFGRIPAPQERAETDDAEFTVMEMDAHRILSVKIQLKNRNYDTPAG
ncbi:MAG: hemolysin family protein [Spirochaetia bacterium]|nr:hemolysin family protein [Spirochaetia bacterium]